jgi:hypothetical protein
MKKLKILGMRYALLECGFIQSIQRHKSKSWAPKTLKERLYRWINPPQLALQAEQLQPKEEIMISCSPSFFCIVTFNIVILFYVVLSLRLMLRGCEAVKACARTSFNCWVSFCLADLALV